MSSQNNILYSVLLYVTGVLYLVYAYFTGNFQNVAIYAVLSTLLLIMHDVIMYGNISFSPQKRIDIREVALDASQNKISQFQKFLLYNRHYFFPTMIICYIFLILINQIFYPIAQNIQNSLLFITIISGIMTVFQPGLDKHYIYQDSSKSVVYTHIILCVFFTLLGSYIVLMQTQTLGYLSLLIGFISGLIIFFVGLSLLEEDSSESPIALR